MGTHSTYGVLESLGATNESAIQITLGSGLSLDFVLLAALVGVVLIAVAWLLGGGNKD